MELACFNIFAYTHERKVWAVGYVRHFENGSDNDLVKFLQERVNSDQELAVALILSEPVTIEKFNYLNRVDRLYELVPEISSAVGNSVFCITFIVDGSPKIEEVYDRTSRYIPPDYLRIYETEDGFDFSGLINDDHFEAPRILWKGKKYISALKLLLSMIDTLGFVEYGPNSNCFKDWLEAYCQLGSLGVTAEELWELRNSLLHMTNLESHKVKQGEIKRLLPVIAGSEVGIPQEVDEFKCLDVVRFVQDVLPNGVTKWLETYNANPDKLLSFVERYDTIVSESRLNVAFQETDES